MVTFTSLIRVFMYLKYWHTWSIASRIAVDSGGTHGAEYAG